MFAMIESILHPKPSKRFNLNSEKKDGKIFKKEPFCKVADFFSVLFRDADKILVSFQAAL
jgi:hypothetical protein